MVGWFAKFHSYIKLVLIASPLGTFCGLESESLEHLLISCPFTNMFWLDFISWCRNVNIELEELSEIDKLFGVWNRREDFLLLNHLLFLSKKHIYECRRNNTRPSFHFFSKNARIHLRIGISSYEIKE